MEDKNTIKKYFDICFDNKYPEFLKEYENVPSLINQKGKGQFCGCDYPKLSIYNINTWFSRFDHSYAAAGITWRLTKDKNQTLSALYHDTGTPCFAHSIDFMLNDSKTQNSSERKIIDVLKGDKKLLELIKEDKINIEDIAHMEKYGVVKNKIPKICTDRLEGITSLGLIACHYFDLEDIKKIYDDISISENKNEIIFNTLEIVEMFYRGAHEYSMFLQTKEDKFTLAYLGDVTKLMIDKKVIEMNDLYNLSEEEVIKKFKQSEYSHIWYEFENMKEVKESDVYIPGKYMKSLDVKKRQVDPLVKTKNGEVRLTTISKEAKELKERYDNFKEKEYAYVDVPQKTLKLLTSNN